MPERLVKALFLVPNQYNDGRKVPQEILDTFQDRLNEVFGGFTLISRDVYGEYVRQNGTVDKDVNYFYSVALKESQISLLRSLLISFGRQLGQEAVYLEIQYGTEVEILLVPDEEEEP